MSIEFVKPKPNPKVRAIVYGGPGVGKTHFALKSPGPVVVLDTEGGTRAFGVRDGFDFLVAETNSPSELEDVLDKLYSGEIKCGTFVIDSVTLLNNVIKVTQQEVAEDRAKRKGKEDDGLTMRDWGKIKNRVSSLVTKIMGVPCHLVMTAWIKNVYAPGMDMQKIGETFDADAKFAYAPDVVLKLGADKDGYFAVVEKDRSGKYPTGALVRGPSLDSFISQSSSSSGGAVRALPDEVKSAKAEAAKVVIEPEKEGTESPVEATTPVRSEENKAPVSVPVQRPVSSAGEGFDREVTKRRIAGNAKGLGLWPVGEKGWPDRTKLAKLASLLAERDGTTTSVDQLSDGELKAANDMLYKAGRGDADVKEWILKLAEQIDKK